MQKFCKQLKKIPQKGFQVITFIFIVYWGITLLSVICISPTVLTQYQRSYSYSSFLPLLGIIAFFIILYVAFRKIKRRSIRNLSAKHFYTMLIISNIIVLVLQIICMFYISKPLTYDFQILRETAISIALDGKFINNSYFSICANNQNILFIFSILMKVFRHWKIVVAAGVLLVNLTVLLTAQMSYKLSGKKWIGWTTFIIGVLLYDFSFRTFVPYMDNWGVFFIVLPLFIVVNKEKMPEKVQGVIIACSLALAVYIKMTCAIIIIAAILTGFIIYRQKINKKNIVGAMLIFIIFILSYNGLSVGRKVYFEQVGFQEDESLRYGIAHYFMMGQNNESFGTAASSDAAFSASYSSVAERNSADLQEGISRILNRGIIGNLKFYTYKNLQNYHDGCFSAVQTLVGENSYGNSFIEKIMIIGEEYYIYFAFVEQTLWTLVMVLIMISAFLGDNQETERDNYILFLQITILGVSAYTLIFESRAKYLFMFVPIYLLLASDGLKMLTGLFHEMADRRISLYSCSNLADGQSGDDSGIFQ